MVTITKMDEANAKLRAACGEDCPSHDMYHLEMDMDGFMQLISDPHRFAAENGLPLHAGDVHISYLHNLPAGSNASPLNLPDNTPGLDMNVQTLTATAQDDAQSMSALTVSIRPVGAPPDPDPLPAKVCCMLTGGTNSFSCFVWPQAV